MVGNRTSQTEHCCFVLPDFENYDKLMNGETTADQDGKKSNKKQPAVTHENCKTTKISALSFEKCLELLRLICYDGKREDPIKDIGQKAVVRRNDIFVFYNMVDYQNNPGASFGNVPMFGVSPPQAQGGLSMMNYGGGTRKMKSIVVPSVSQCPTCRRNTLMTNQVVEIPDPDQQQQQTITTMCPTCQAPITMAANAPEANFRPASKSVMMPKLTTCPNCRRNTLWTQEMVNVPDEQPQQQYVQRQQQQQQSTVTECTTCRQPMVVNSTNFASDYSTMAAQQMSMQQQQYQPMANSYSFGGQGMSAPTPQMNPAPGAYSMFGQSGGGPSNNVTSVPKITNCQTCGQTQVSYENVAMQAPQISPSISTGNMAAAMTQKMTQCPECRRNTLLINEYAPPPQMASSGYGMQPSLTQCPQCRRNTLVTAPQAMTYGGAAGNVMQNQQCPSCKRMTLCTGGQNPGPINIIPSQSIPTFVTPPFVNMPQSQFNPYEYAAPPMQMKKVFCDTCMQPMDDAGGMYGGGPPANMLQSGGAGGDFYGSFNVPSFQQNSMNQMMSMMPSYSAPQQQQQQQVRTSVVPTITQCPECRRNTLVTQKTVVETVQTAAPAPMPQMSYQPANFGFNSTPQQMFNNPMMSSYMPSFPTNPGANFMGNSGAVMNAPAGICPTCQRALEMNPSNALCPLCKRPTIF